MTCTDLDEMGSWGKYTLTLVKEVNNKRSQGRKQCKETFY